MFFILGQSQFRLTSAESIFFGFGGLAVMFHSNLVGPQNGCIALVFLTLAALMLLVFWILLWSSVAYTSYQPLLTAKLLSFSVHRNLLHDYHCEKILIGVITMSTCELCPPRLQNVPMSSYNFRFVDRDMFMRFFGGGIGHKATNKYTAALRGDALAMVNAQSTTAASTIVEEIQGVAESDEVAQFAEKEDYGYELSDAEDEDSECDEDDDGANLGAEDGEEPWQMGDLYAEGYDDL